MGKQVVVVASGETERRAIPPLVSHLEETGVVVLEVLVPPNHQPLRVKNVAGVVRASWYSRLDAPPDKFVVLVDTDRSAPDELLDPLRHGLRGRLPDGAEVLFAHAQQHLEAWFFAHSEKLREYLGRSLGSVDASRPDRIPNPKLHLRKLLRRKLYTSRVAGEIARLLDPRIIAGRSPGFRSFLDAVRNGSDGT